MINLATADITAHTRKKKDPLVVLDDRIASEGVIEAHVELETTWYKALSAQSGSSVRGEIAAIFVWNWRRIMEQNKQIVGSGTHYTEYEYEDGFRLVGDLQLTDPYKILVPMPIALHEEIGLFIKAYGRREAYRLILANARDELEKYLFQIRVVALPTD